jgi:hypothetical protein
VTPAETRSADQREICSDEFRPGRRAPGGSTLATIDDDAAFGTVHVDQVGGTVCWPSGIDLDPDVLHGDHSPASGQSARLVREYRQPASV